MEAPWSSSPARDLSTEKHLPGILFTAVLALTADARAAPLPALHLIDDRGQAIEKAVEACFRVELRTECQPVPAGEAVRPPASFYSLRIEGDSHGPIDLRREALQAQPDGSFRVTVPRKARLRIESGERRQPLTLSLYRPQDPTFREPVFRFRLEPGEHEMNVPAGELIASLALANNAPDLQRLSTQPGGRGRMTYHQRQHGYRESQSIDIQVEKDSPIPPVTLVLKRKSTVQGQILSAGGSPVPSAWIGSSGSSLEQGPFLFSEVRSTTDGHFEVETPPEPPRVFFSGPDCPLSWLDVPAGTGSDENASQDPAPFMLHCSSLPAALELTLVDETGKPLPHAGVILRQGSTIVPQGVLASHLRSLGLSPQTDGAGRLVLAGLSPGDYELFLSALSSESTIAGGRLQGWLTAVSLPFLQTTALQVTLTSSSR
jgi:hypothetical protein